MPIYAMSRSSAAKSMPSTIDEETILFIFHEFGDFVETTLSVAIDIVTKSFAKTRSDMPSREISIL